jgi:hypothetical protein
MQFNRNPAPKQFSTNQLYALGGQFENIVLMELNNKFESKSA